MSHFTKKKEGTQGRNPPKVVLFYRWHWTFMGNYLYSEVNPMLLVGGGLGNSGTVNKTMFTCWV